MSQHQPFFHDLNPFDYYLFASICHSVAKQHFSNFEEAGKRLDKPLPVNTGQLPGKVFISSPYDGQSGYKQMDHILNKQIMIFFSDNFLFTTKTCKNR